MLGRHGTHRAARLDVAIVVVLAVYGQLEAWRGPGAETAIAGPPVLNAAAFLIASTALLWRRRAPVTVLVIEAVNLAALSVLAGGSEALGLFVPLLVSVYSAARYAAIPWRTFPVLALVAAALLLHDLRDPQVDQASDVVVFWLILAAAWPVGAAIRRWSDRTELLAAEAAAREARARTEERARIARELHDVVSHSLGVMLVQAEAADAIAEPGDARVRERLGRIRSSGRDALGDMRRVLGLLRDDDAHVDAEPQPGTARLPELVQRVRTTGLQVELRVDGDPPPLIPSADLALYRIVQEGLTNTLKHAHASRVDVQIRYTDDAVEIALADDGRGRPADARDGHGLVGMRERAALYGGAVHAGNRAGGGFEVHAHLPLPR
jgi:signal transduction histidine kinase